MDRASSYLLLGFEGTDEDLFITFGLGGSAAAVVSVGVGKSKRRTINLSEQTDRNRASEFIKQQLALDRARAEQLAAQEALSANPKVRHAPATASADSVSARLAAAEAAKLAQDKRNNAIMSIIMLSAQ